MMEISYSLLEKDKDRLVRIHDFGPMAKIESSDIVAYGSFRLTKILIGHEGQSCTKRSRRSGDPNNSPSDLINLIFTRFSISNINIPSLSAVSNLHREFRYRFVSTTGITRIIMLIS